MSLFYCPNIENEHSLSEEESRHAIKVLRLKLGDNIELLDGKGALYLAKITSDNPTKCDFEILSETKHQQRPYFLEIMVSPTKNADRIEWFVEKATEIGVDKITLIETERTERKKVRLDRLEKIATSAMKQSKTYFLPQITELISFKKVAQEPFKGQRFIAHCIEDDKKHLKNQLNPKSTYQIVIGPEGDFTADEINLAMENGFLPVTFGENRLRTETAAVYACTLANVVNA